MATRWHLVARRAVVLAVAAALALAGAAHPGSARAAATSGPISLVAIPDEPPVVRAEGLLDVETRVARVEQPARLQWYEQGYVVTFDSISWTGWGSDAAIGLARAEACAEGRCDEWPDVQITVDEPIVLDCLGRPDVAPARFMAYGRIQVSAAAGSLVSSQPIGRPADCGAARATPLSPYWLLQAPYETEAVAFVKRRPRQVRFFLGSGTTYVFSDLDWGTWNTRRAAATGRSSICTRDNATGRTRCRSGAGRISLEDVHVLDCDDAGYRYYGRFTWNAVGGEKGTVEQRPHCDRLRRR